MSSSSRATDRGFQISSQPSAPRESRLRTRDVRLEDILITDELRKRGGREPKWKEESIALSMLAGVVATAPERLVDTLLGMALELCGAETAGLSMLESGPSNGGEQVFRWTNLAGTLQGHIGGSTPRNFSPCGVCTDAGAAQLFSHPEHYFTYFEKANVPFVEALVIPVRVGGKIPGTIWILSHTEGKGFDAEDVRIMTDLADFTGCALGLLASAQAEQQAREKLEREVEIRHRKEEELREIQAGLETVIQARTWQLQQLSARLLSTQDEQGRRLARELHDSVGQYLAALGMNIGKIMRESKSLSEAQQLALTDSMQLIERSDAEIRTISYLLHPPSLDAAGLASAISWFAKGFAERSGIQVDFDCAGKLGRFAGEVETALFRVVQQSLVNIHRHSGSRTAKIHLAVGENVVRVEICDDGCGISPEILNGIAGGTRLTGVGIAGMRERIRMLGGQFNVKSSENGTTIEASLPVEPR
jgi:signal transduction histidine kinase